MGDLVTDGQALFDWLTEGISDRKFVQTSKWIDLWVRLIEGNYSNDQAEFLFQRITAIGRNVGALGTFKSRASEGRRIWRYSKQHNVEALALLRSGTGYHKIIAQFPTKIDTTWRQNQTSLHGEVFGMISELNDFELSTVHAFLCQLLSSRES